MRLVPESHIQLIFKGSGSFILAQKLKALKATLDVWNREVFGKVETNKGRNQQTYPHSCYDSQN